MQAMKESGDKQPLEDIVQLDNVYWGGKGKGGKRGRGSEKKTPLVAEVQMNDEMHPIYIRMSMVDGFKEKEITNWGKKHIEEKTLVIADGLTCFDGLVDVDVYYDIENKSKASDNA